MDIESEIEATASEMFDYAEKEIKTLLGDLWNEHEKEAQEWVALVAELQWRIAQCKTPMMTESTKKHVEFGLKCFLRKIKSKSEANVYRFVSSFFQMLLDRAVAIGLTIAKSWVADKLEEHYI